MGRILAIDYGTKRTGLAVTDPGQVIATPLETVATHDLMNFIAQYVTNEKVDLVVVGLPKKMDGTESDSVKYIRNFVRAFRKRFGNIPVEWMDERFTSRMAAEAMILGGMKKASRRIKGQVDKLSASLILQSYLQQRNNPS